MTIKIQQERGVVKINWNKFSELFEISDDEKEFFEMIYRRRTICRCVIGILIIIIIVLLLTR